MEKSALCQEIAAKCRQGYWNGKHKPANKNTIVSITFCLIEHSSGIWIPLKKYVTVNGEDTPNEYF